MELISKHGLVTPSTYQDADELAATARRQDIREVEDISGKPLFLNLIVAVGMGKPCLTARTLSGELLCMMGIVPIGKGQGAIAMIGTPLIEQERFSFLRGAKDVMSYLESRTDYDFLCNVVDARNKLHIDFLKWLGFSMLRKVEGYGAAKIPVVEFCKFINK